MNTVKPSNFELQILSILWEQGPRTAREVLESLSDGKKRAYTSVLSVMQVMEKKGLLTRTREGLADRWRHAVERDQVAGPFLRRVVTQLFGGRPSVVLQRLLEEGPMDREEIQSIKRLIRDYEKNVPVEKRTARSSGKMEEAGQ